MSQSVIIVGVQSLTIEERARELQREGYHVELLHDVAAAKDRLAQEAVDILAVDVNLLDDGGAGLIEWALGEQRASLAMGFGQKGFAAEPEDLDLPIPPRGVLSLVPEKRRSSAKEQREQDEADERAFWRAGHAPEMIGEAPEIIELIDMVRNVADTDCPVLISGESGTGKELIARALHLASPRRSKHFVALNCAAIPETLIEAELFGHARGAFTGAHVAREGRFMVADGGTLFLDEIGDMPLILQSKLLRVLQERSVTAVGESLGRPVDVRIIAATHSDLEMLVDEGKFRADLYYRLNVIPLRAPPLRERASDIPRLARYFLKRANDRLGRHVVGFDAAAEAQLALQAWPGNVRELQNLVERMVVLKGRGMVTAHDLVPHLPSARRSEVRVRTATPVRPVTVAMDAPPAASPRRWEGSLDLRAAQDDLERQLIHEALARTNGNRTEAAALLGLNRTTLVEKLRKIA